jgi:predicted ATPase
LLRAAFSAHEGVEVDTQGDAFFAAFTRASDAVAAAAAIQTQLAQGPIRVRIGLHTGEPVRTKEGYVGIDLTRGARVCAAGHGGQVLLSQATRDLVDVDTSDLGEHRLKDLPEPQRLYQLGTAEFPPLKTLNSTNLPVQSTPLVGRERELTEAVSLLREHRLLTLVGPPGTGKTRLALQLAAELADEFEQVWWVALQHVRDPNLVEPTIAQTIGARRDLPGYLRNRRGLLLLDNLEQVLGCAPRLAQLVAGSSNLKLLATSREPLHLTLEQQYPVPPLPERDALTLFHERASAVRPGFAANGAVAEICRRLDGLPLAIELAAARVKVLPPDALLARLELRLPLLTGGGRDLPERQRTLRATIEWSYDLLDPHEQNALARLSVFSGWTLEAAAAVCDCDLEMLASLVDKSLIHVQDGRFSMLETIREYGRERLEESGDAEELRSRHLEHYVGIAERSARELEGPAQTVWLPQLEDEHDNFRAAEGWARESENGELASRLAIALWVFRFIRGHIHEARAALESAVEETAELPALRMKALEGIAFLAPRQGDFARTQASARAAIALSQVLGDEQTEGRCLRALSRAVSVEDDRAAVSLLEQAAVLSRKVGDHWNLSIVTNNLGSVALDSGEFDRAAALFDEAARLAHKRGDARTSSLVLVNVSEAAYGAGRLDEAEAAAVEAIRIARDLGYAENLSGIRHVRRNRNVARSAPPRRSTARRRRAARQRSSAGTDRVRVPPERSNARQDPRRPWRGGPRRRSCGRP